MNKLYNCYCVTNMVNGFKYIGITVRDPLIRFKEHIHYSDKCSERCENLLHNAILEYGLENFVLNILETDIIEELRDYKEQYYINLYNTLFPNGYNKSTGGIKCHNLNYYSKLNLSINGSGIKNSRCKKYILQFDFDGNLIGKFGSAREAARKLGFNNHKNILYNLSGKTKYAYNYIWKYEE